MSEFQTSDQTDRPDLLNYYSFRLTVPHKDYGQVQEILNKYSSNYCVAFHQPRPQTVSVGDNHDLNEHFHIIFLDLDDKKIDAMKKAFRMKFDRSGNGFYAGKKMDNHVYKALQYFKHDNNVEWKHRGAHWQEYIDGSPDWDSNMVPKVTKKMSTEERLEKSGYPKLTFGNILYQCFKYRNFHNLKTDDLDVVLTHMTVNTDWEPHHDVGRRGLDVWHFKKFRHMCHHRTSEVPKWWTPHHD